MMKLLELYEDVIKYPDAKWVMHQLRWNAYAYLNRDQLKKIRELYVVGSSAKGTDRPDSDIDIAVIMEPIRGTEAIKFTERFQDKFPSDAAKPTFNNRIVDFQFFWTTDTDWQSYKKIKI